MTRNKEYFADFATFAQPVNVEVGNGDAIPAYGRSTVNFKVFNIKGKWILNRMEDVYYVPKLGLNLFSIGKAAEKGFNFTANADGCTFRKNGRVKLSGIRSLNGIYKLYMRLCIPEKPAYVHLSAVDASLQLWHERLCYRNKRHVQQVLNNHGIKVYAQEEFCTGCVYGKHHRESFYSHEMIDHITFQSNLYAHRECNNWAFTVSPQEIRQFIGVILLSGYNCQPEAKHYWSTQPDIGAQGAISCMSHNRFMEIKNYLHLVVVEGDKMSKVTPLYKLLNSSLVKHGMFHEKLSVDESIVPYFGRHAAKMFLKCKPIQFGYKVWILCGNDGYPYHMIIYQRKEIHAPKVPLSTRVIRSMVDVIQETSNTTRHALYFDSFFNSYDLLVMLSELKMRAIGTIRPYRSKGADAVMLPDKDLLKQKRVEEGEEQLSPGTPYREAVGALMFLMTATRPDIAYAVSTVSQANGEGVLKGYSDADYVGDVTTRRSRTGVVCTCAGGAVSWHSQKQKSVALSTTEAEYVAAGEGAKDMMWLMSLFAEVTEVKQKPILFVDNMGAVKLSKNPEFYKRSNHIEVRFHFVREKYNEGKIDIQHIDSENQKAEILTKALPKTRFQNLR
ncbi:conserved hypothetical protein [Trichinella spiralis]|uniref:hypothetical protein n=1 Tax=Trichinella spiralis TaxID=6334 RepID=UPI0001EFBF4B|nr:conserved hypothetical protein [Trichinella spiralis]